MANKFGLLFSDLKGNRKLLMIDDSAYSGAVKPLIGTGEPIELTYESDDDIHNSPIMGSRMEMNLWVTNTRTNLIPYSTQFNQWTTSLIVTTNDADAPFEHINRRNLLTSGDTEEADRLQYAGGATGCSLSVTLAANTQYTASVYVKQYSTNTTVSVGIDTDETNDMQNTFSFDTKASTISNDADGGGSKSLGNGWYRIYVTGTTGSTVTNATIKVNNVLSSGIYWGAQLETGSAPTQFIYTDTTAINNDYDVFYEQNDRKYLAKLYYEESGSYEEMWRGYITKDIYKEAIVSKPYEIRLVATDGLGELSGASFTPSEINYEDIGVSYDSLSEVLANALGHTGHSFDIYALLDLRYKDGLTLKHVLEQDHLNVAKKDWGIWNPKELIQELMRSLNAKIFQAFGRWYVVSNSAYYDTRVQDASYTTSNGGGTVTGIKDDLNDYLTVNGNEHLKFQIFNSSGVKGSTTTETDKLLKIPSDLQPLRQDFIRDYLPAVKSVEYIVDSESYNSSTKFTTVSGQDQAGKFLNVNGSFEATAVGSLPTYTWTEITQDDYSYQGNNVWLSSGNSGYVSPLTSSTFTAQYVKATSPASTPFNDGVEFSIKVKPETSATTVQLRWQLKRSNTTSVPTTSYWNHITGQFTTTLTNNQTTIVKDEWNTIKVSVPKSLVNTATDQLTFTLYKPAITAADPNFKLYMDHVQFKKQGDLVAGDAFLRTQANQTDKYNLDSKMYIPYGQRSREFQSTVDKNNHLGRAVSQMILNDRREYLAIYEGTFYNNNATPVTPVNKIWIDFGSSVLQEELSGIIKKMAYKVKSNEVNMRFYLPNPDDDITNTFKLRKNV